MDELSNGNNINENEAKENKTNMAAEMFKAYLEAKEIKYKFNAPSSFWLYFNLKNDTELTTDINVEFSENEKYAFITAGKFVRVTNKEKYKDLYKLLNELNVRWNWIKFLLLEESGEILAVHDAIIQYDSCGEEIFELLGRMIGVIEESYSDIMKAIWN